MASSSTTSPDTLVTLKINHDGTNRRFKLPLRDLGIAVFEDKLRTLLFIPTDTETVFERYSDSAGAYVVLDRANLAVYKQLNRAAKAKQKLKLRVTAKKPEPIVEEEIEKKGPKPASVEDEVEETAAAPVAQMADAPVEPETPAVASAPSTTPVEAAPTEAVAEPSAKAGLSKHLAAMESTLEALQANMVASMAMRPASLSQPQTGCAVRTNYAVCCNSCDRTIPQAHYHCSTCDDGDFDLCQDCVDQGVTCNDADHWLIKRFVRNGVIINSTTERIAPKPKSKPQSVEESLPCTVSEPSLSIFNPFYSSIRTCNSCVQELPEVEFVHCTTCEDFDLCRACFAKNRHGHHPKHGFVSAVEGTRLEPEVAHRLTPGRNQTHSAICDGCDETIKGIRHKCLDCPDWDYCSTCVENATFIHPGHRFVPIYEPLELASCTRMRSFSRPTHVGICCDGPLCSSARTSSAYIVGDRFKCAVCDDTDFCAGCEANPANTHNKTHPLIKFKTPVRHVSVTTSGEHENGRPMPAMGDRARAARSSVTNSRATETAPQNLATNVLTVVDVKPSAPAAIVEEKEEEVKIEEVEETKPVELKKPLVVETPTENDLNAVFVRDTIADGTVLGPDHVFEQTWVLRNEGTTSWPAGCSVKYVSGDYMGHVDSTHPAATEDLESSSESTICYTPISPGMECAFTVLLRTPPRSGRVVSNWRLTTKDGLKFGHRLWCDVVVVKKEEPSPETAEVPAVKAEEVKAEEPTTQQSQMIFPKLEKESPVASIHEEARSESAPSYDEDYADCGEDDEWDESEAFLTDEEYEILDASDEEYNEGQPLRK